jgi:hypothetical protein
MKNGPSLVLEYLFLRNENAIVEYANIKIYVV